MTTAPFFVLGVSRSGTTMLRVMLDRHSWLAVPDESFFIPQLADRHRGPVRVEAFVDDLRRLETLRAWNVDVEAVRQRLTPGMPLGEAIAAVYLTYAADRGKRRWGDKTPLYMQHLPLLERLFPGALYVHLVRDGRDVASSFLSLPPGVTARGFALPRSVAAVAAMWRSEIKAARSLAARVGDARYLELRYEHLVASPEDELSRVCAFLGLEFEAAMRDYSGGVDVSSKPHQQRLRRPPTAGVRDWRYEMTPAEIRAFASVAGDLLSDLGYEVKGRRTARGRATCVAYNVRVTAWKAAGRAVRVSPLWRRRHPPL